MRFYLIQFRWYRKYRGGVYFLIYTPQLGMGPFWSESKITSCQSKTLRVECFPSRLMRRMLKKYYEK